MANLSSRAFSSSFKLCTSFQNHTTMSSVGDKPRYCMGQCKIYVSECREIFSIYENVIINVDILNHTRNRQLWYSFIQIFSMYKLIIIIGHWNNAYINMCILSDFLYTWYIHLRIKKSYLRFSYMQCCTCMYQLMKY